ncbi:MAG: uncharacterized protein JWR50_3491 [Mucilaginibacter sp.]|nr:uncharacterized protein [Mucilaginibacter sp.]
METLNQFSTKIFCELIGKMQGKDHLKITNEPFMPLTIEKIGEGITTPWGEGEQYSLCHYYEQNGDLMQDPEMCFIITSQQNYIVPYLYTQAALGIYEESILIKNSQMLTYKRTLQLHHVVFANTWLRNIQAQGFLKCR